MPHAYTWILAVYLHTLHAANAGSAWNASMPNQVVEFSCSLFSVGYERRKIWVLKSAIVSQEQDQLSDLLQNVNMWAEHLHSKYGVTLIFQCHWIDSAPSSVQSQAAWFCACQIIFSSNLHFRYANGRNSVAALFGTTCVFHPWQRRDWDWVCEVHLRWDPIINFWFPISDRSSSQQNKGSCRLDSWFRRSSHQDLDNLNLMQLIGGNPATSSLIWSVWQCRTEGFSAHAVRMGIKDLPDFVAGVSLPVFQKCAKHIVNTGAFLYSINTSFQSWEAKDTAGLGGAAKFQETVVWNKNIGGFSSPWYTPVLREFFTPYLTRYR